MKFDKIINLIREMNEEAPTMSVGAGGIAGLEPAQPPVNLKKRKRERKYMKGPGRKVWLDFLKGNQ